MALLHVMNLLIVGMLYVAGIYGQELRGINDTRGDLVWKAQGSGAHRDFSCFSSYYADGRSFHVLGHHAQTNNHVTIDTPILALTDSSQDPDALSAPESYTFIWSDRGTWDGSIVRPNCSEGYVSLGDVMYGSHRSVPNHIRLTVRCVKVEYTVPCEFGPPIWTDHGSMAASGHVELLSVRCSGDDHFHTDFFYASNTYDMLPTTKPYGLKRSHVNILF